MKFKAMFVVPACICFAQPILSLTNKASTSQSARLWNLSQTPSRASAKQSRLGETIKVRKGVFLKIVPGSSKTKEVFGSENSYALVLDLEFEITHDVRGGIIAIAFSDSADKSDVFLTAAEEKITPKTLGGVRMNLNDPNPTVRVQDNLHSMFALLEGKRGISLLFELNGNQFKQKKKLVLSLEIKEVDSPDERHSLVIDLDNKVN